MTTLAQTPVPLRRLFRRLDFAPVPTDDFLGRLLAVWQARRDELIFPSERDLDIEELDPEGKCAFVYGVPQQGLNYTLRSGAKSLDAVLGHCEVGASLAAAPRRRGAVRLRRLFEVVRQAGEPLLAEFTLDEAGGEPNAAEILLAPLSEDGHTVDAIVGGLSLRPMKADGSSPKRRAVVRPDGPMLFALGSSAAFGERVARRLGIMLAPHEERFFEDGEHKARPLSSVRDRDVYVFDSLTGDSRHTSNDKLCRMLFFIGALRDAGAGRVTAMVPYLCYSRKDRRTKSRDPVTTRYVAQLFEAVGTDRLMTMEIHNLAAFQNAFRHPTVHLDANSAFVGHFAAEVGDAPVAVVSPDLGGAKRAEIFRERLETTLGRPVAKGFMDKQRSGGVVTGELFAGDVDGRMVIVVDDLISTGTTMARVAAVCRAKGATRVSVAATHGLFTGGADALWGEAAIDDVVITDTVKLPALDAGAVANRLVVLETADIFADAITECSRSEFGIRRRP
ncbi:MAG TPA: ribose-phosphate pyrophosphokinase [Aurantimonas sp.]